MKIILKSLFAVFSYRFLSYLHSMLYHPPKVVSPAAAVFLSSTVLSQSH